MAMIELNTAPVASTPMFLDGVQPLLLDHLRHREDFRDRLDRHLGLDVASREDPAVYGDQDDAEQIRIHLGERRDVVGVLAFLEVLELLDAAFTAAWDRCRLVCASCSRQRRRRRRMPPTTPVAIREPFMS